MLLLSLHTLTGSKFDLFDICSQIATYPQVIDPLADVLENGGFITKATSQAIKADSTLPPYSRASRMLVPAIECANRNPEKHEKLAKILTSAHFGVSL